MAAGTEKKKKKNFKDVTGIKFADLIMPLVLGGVGSYSNAAGRGVGIGLQAFRTLQAGKEYGQERELAEKTSESISNLSRELQQQKAGIQGEMFDEDVSEAQYWMPQEEPVEEVVDESALVSPQERASQLSLFGPEDDPNTMTPEQRQAAESSIKANVDAIKRNIASPDGETPAADMPEQDYVQAILGAKGEREAKMHELGIIDDRITFFDQMAALAQVNPSSAGYLVGQGLLMDMSDDQKYAYLTRLEKGQAKSREEREAMELRLIHERGDQAAKNIRLRADLNKWSPMISAEFGEVAFNKKDGQWYDKDGNLLAGRTARQIFTPKEIIQQYRPVVQTYLQMKKAIENGELAPDDENYERVRDLAAELSRGIDDWMIQAENARAASTGEPPIRKISDLDKEESEIEAEDAAAGVMSDLGLVPGGDADPINKFVRPPLQ